MRLSRARSRRDTSALTMRHLLTKAEAGDIESAIVLGDALEEHGLPNIGQGLVVFAKRPGASFSSRTGQHVKSQVEKAIFWLEQKEPSPIVVQRLALRFVKLRGRAKHEAAMQLADAMEKTGWPDKKNEVPTGRRGPAQVWDVHSLDVWGNRREGFEVNNEFRIGTIRLTTQEVVQGIKSYAEAYRAGHREMANGWPLMRLVYVNHETDEGALWRALKQEYLAAHVKRRHIEIDWQGESFISVRYARTGKPLYHLYAARGRDDS